MLSRVQAHTILTERSLLAVTPASILANPEPLDSVALRELLPFAFSFRAARKRASRSSEAAFSIEVADTSSVSSAVSH